MTSKQIRLIAGVLANVRDNMDESGRWHNDAYLALDAVTSLFAHELGAVNERFDYERFMAAAGHRDWQEGDPE